MMDHVYCRSVLVSKNAMMFCYFLYSKKYIHTLSNNEVFAVLYCTFVFSRKTKFNIGT